MKPTFDSSPLWRLNHVGFFVLIGAMRSRKDAAHGSEITECDLLPCIF